MRMQVLISALVLMLGMLALPANAAPITGLRTAVMSQETPGGHLQSVGLSSNDIKHMTLAQAAAIIGGAIAGGSVMDRLIDRTAFTVLGVVAGAVLGNEWFDRGMWPF